MSVLCRADPDHSANRRADLIRGFNRNNKMSIMKYILFSRPAKEHGLAVSERGRIRVSVAEQYHAVGGR